MTCIQCGKDKCDQYMVGPNLGPFCSFTCEARYRLFRLEYPSLLHNERRPASFSNTWLQEKCPTAAVNYKAAYEETEKVCRYLQERIVGLNAKITVLQNTKSEREVALDRTIHELRRLLEKPL